MIIPDTNLLIYAYDSDSKQHDASRAWLEDCLNGEETVGLPWVVVCAFIRISTNRAAVRSAFSADEAADIVQSWLVQPVVRLISSGEDFSQHFLRLIREHGTAGNLTTDAQIAAHAIENQATVYSNDSEFDRFPGLRWRNPIKSA